MIISMRLLALAGVLVLGWACAACDTSEFQPDEEQQAQMDRRIDYVNDDHDYSK